MMAAASANPFSSRLLTTLEVGSRSYQYYSLPKLSDARIARLPYSIKVLLESAVRCCDSFAIRESDVERILDWQRTSQQSVEIPFQPARVLMQDFTGVPAVVDLAAMRDAMARLGGDPSRINPLVPADLVVDHSVQVDFYRSADAMEANLRKEMERNHERFAFLKWGSQSFRNFLIVPPGSGIVHQVNLEYLAHVAFNSAGLLYPDSVVGTDSHTTMINGLGVMGWGVGGIEAEAVMLGQPISMVLPEVIGYKLTGRLPSAVTATDLVLTITERLRQRGVVDKFVEFFGPGLLDLSLADRATISNMGPEYGATVGFFPVDSRTIEYLRQTNRDEEKVAMIEAYLRANELFIDHSAPAADAHYTAVMELDLSTVVPSLAGPKRPHDRVSVRDAKADLQKALTAPVGFKGYGLSAADVSKTAQFEYRGKQYSLKHGDVVIAAITSCTNTSNPSVMIGAGLLAKKAVAKGLHSFDYIKTSLGPGSGVVTRYLEASGLQPYLSKLGFDLVGYGCTTCIGNSGDLLPEVSAAIEKGDIVASAVLSGNRNFEGRVHPLTRANYLASPPLVVAYAIAGSVLFDFESQPLGRGSDGSDVFLRDIWPSSDEIAKVVSESVLASMFRDVYRHITEGSSSWNELQVSQSILYNWDDQSTYIHHPPFFQTMTEQLEPVRPISNAYCLLNLGDCFPEVDTRVLTNFGLLFLDQIEALLRAGADVLFGCYDVESRALLYRKGQLVCPESLPQELLEFTSRGEDARWVEGSGPFGIDRTPEDNPQSRHVSLRVTPGHRMFVQTGNKSRDTVSKTGKTQLGRVKWESSHGVDLPHRQVTARSLLSECACPPADDCAHRRPSIRLLACAKAGFVPQSTVRRDEVMRLLRLSRAQFLSFLKLLGFWIGDGTMQYALSSGGRNAVQFSQSKASDRQWLQEMLPKVGLTSQHWRRYSSSDGSEEKLYITHQAWFSFFDKEFGRKYQSSQYNTANSPPSTTRPLLPSSLSSEDEDVPIRVDDSEDEDMPMEVDDSPPPLEPATPPPEEPSEPDSDDEKLVPLPLPPLPVPAVPLPGSLPPETTKSAKHLPDWALAELSADEMRLLIEGVQRADGCWKAWVRKTMDEGGADGGDDDDDDDEDEKVETQARKKKIYTSSARFRDQLMHALLNCGFSAYCWLKGKTGETTGYKWHDQKKNRKTYSVKHVSGLSTAQQRKYVPIVSTTESWVVSWTELQDNNAPAMGSCYPQMQRQASIKRVPYSAARDGRLWCVDVRHNDHLIVAQRAQRNADGVVTKQSRPIITGNSITTDHISPAGDIAKSSPAAHFLIDRGVDVRDLNTYGARRGNDLVMCRGTFANIRLVNKLVPKSGPNTLHVPSGQQLAVWDAAARYMADGQQLIILAGKDYGSGSSRDWAAKGPKLQGVRAVVAVSFERIHRSNLVGMGIIPLVFQPGQNADTLGLTGKEQFSIDLTAAPLAVGQTLTVLVSGGSVSSFQVKSRLDTEAEIAYYKNGGSLQYVLRRLVREGKEGKQ